MKDVIKTETAKEEVLFVIGRIGEDTRTITLDELSNGKKELVMAKAFGYDFIKPYKKAEKSTIAMMDGTKFHINENGVKMYDVCFMDAKRFSPNEQTTLVMVADETVAGGFYWTHIFRDGSFVHGLKFAELEKFSSQSKRTKLQKKRIKEDQFLNPQHFSAHGLKFDGTKEILFLMDYMKEDEIIKLELNEKGKELLARHDFRMVINTPNYRGIKGFNYRKAPSMTNEQYHDLKVMMDNFFIDQDGEDIPYITVHDVDFTNTGDGERVERGNVFVRNSAIHWLEGNNIKHCLRKNVQDNSKNQTLMLIWDSAFPDKTSAKSTGPSITLDEESLDIEKSVGADFESDTLLMDLTSNLAECLKNPNTLIFNLYKEAREELTGSTLPEAELENAAIERAMRRLLDTTVSISTGTIENDISYSEGEIISQVQPEPEDQQQSQEEETQSQDTAPDEVLAERTYDSEDTLEPYK